ncbi:MAG: 3'(2'),5'-bisphosphate nucleotidase CysQ [Lentimicrobiaceae bacterium]|nr:3'(2'),5'-bisphosphate nucleotidase CysQ [Lentimicrobiaceae bacterium]MCO5265950.1 3'(2'),5'-bisphosphate nucleotidase CysQ [Lentimicrobium sp.]
MNNSDYSALLKIAIRTSVEAGRIILEYYSNNYEITYKEDASPLTSADIAANKHICNSLLPTNIPLISEEEKDVPFKIRQKWDEYWLIDPIDGTKEFINRNGQFTVNIALIKNQQPHIGVIYIPVSEELYFGLAGFGSFKMHKNVSLSDINHQPFEYLLQHSDKLPTTFNTSIIKIIVSKSHLNQETTDLISVIKSGFPKIELIQIGSSLKFCRLAEGEAHYYPRSSRTMEWDTAAGHAIAAFAGINVLNLSDKKPLTYNKENLENPSFIAFNELLPFE